MSTEKDSYPSKIIFNFNSFMTLVFFDFDIHVYYICLFVPIVRSDCLNDLFLHLFRAFIIISNLSYKKLDLVFFTLVLGSIVHFFN